MAKKALIVEDHVETAELIMNLLKSEGIDVITAADGITGMERAFAENPDIILLDVMMPGMTGLEVCEKLKADSRTAAIPIVIVSVRAAENNIKQGLSYGANEYIAKPFDPFKLIEVVKKELGI